MLGEVFFLGCLFTAAKDWSLETCSASAAVTDTLQTAAQGVSRLLAL